MQIITSLGELSAMRVAGNWKGRFAMRWVILGAMGLVTLCSNFNSADADVFDLNSDWSDTTNPNGVWSYNAGVNPLPHQDKLGLPYLVSNQQPGWGPSDGSTLPPPPFLPIWFKAVQSNPTDQDGNPLDWHAGDIVTHSQDDYNGLGEGKSNVTFTYPGPDSAVANISGSVWMARDVGRAVGWALYLDSTLLTEGSVYSGDPYDRNSPFSLAAGSGGTSAVTNLLLQADDVIKLEFTSEVDAAAEIVGEFVGANFSVTTVPEPSSFILVGAGAVSLLACTWLRRK